LSISQKNLLIWIRDIVIAFVLILLIMQFIKPTIVREHSMEDTLNPDDYIFLNKQAYVVRDIKRGDVVVFNTDLVTEDGVMKKLIKRVIALPGDTVSIHDGGVYIDGNMIDEPYTKGHVTEGTMEEVRVPANRMFLLGDNRQHSIDSRDPSIGFVSMNKLVGRAVFRLFPLSGVGFVK
jgi:signal peptidase I